MISGLASLFFALFPGMECIALAGGGLTLSLALSPIVVQGNITAGVMENVRRWHGSIDDQFANINNLVNNITEHKVAWTVPAAMLADLTYHRNELQKLINKCRTNDGSRTDRQLRSSMLKSTVGYCLRHVRMWAYGQYNDNVMTEDDVHLLGFLLPGEMGGHHGRTESTDVKSEVKVTVLNEDAIHVVIDQSAGENAARVAHGWPKGVRNALIVIYASDGVTEVVRQHTTRLHNDIRMPEGSRGKQFVIKASFLKHVDDAPLFGNEPTFSMPLNTADLLAILDRQHHEEFEEHVRETELHRQEIERLHAEIEAQKK
jgi:hypothetical protein